MYSHILKTFKIQIIPDKLIKILIKSFGTKLPRNLTNPTAYFAVSVLVYTIDVQPMRIIFSLIIYMYVIINNFKVQIKL